MDGCWDGSRVWDSVNSHTDDPTNSGSLPDCCPFLMVGRTISGIQARFEDICDLLTPGPCDEHVCTNGVPYTMADGVTCDCDCSGTNFFS